MIEAECAMANQTRGNGVMSAPTDVDGYLVL